MVTAFCQALSLSVRAMSWQTLRLRLLDVAGAVQIATSVCNKLLGDLFVMQRSDLSQVVSRPDDTDSTRLSTVVVLTAAE